MTAGPPGLPVKDDFSEVVVAAGSTLRDVLAALDRNGLGVVFVVDRDRVMRGLLTDGDVRRALLGGVPITAPVDPHMNRDFISGSSLRTPAENLALISERIRTLPILDARGELVDLIRWKDLCWLPVTEPALEGREVEYVLDCLATNWISSQGKYVDRFERRFESYLGAGQALSVSNGTAALHLAMAALGIGPGDEVIVPDLTFVAPASMAALCGAKPVFVDVDPATWTMDPAEVEARITPRTKAIVPVHLYGHPCDMDPILEIAGARGLRVVEDCAEALGAEYKGRKVGTLGDIGTFSFFANKVITTGEGGMVCTRDPALAERMRLLRDHGMTREKRYWHEVAGFNYRLTNLQAAIGLAQMERIERILEDRQEIVARYDALLEGIPGLVLPPREPWARNIFWLYSVVLDERVAGFGRNALMAQLADHGIDTRPFFIPMHRQPAFRSEADRPFPVSARLSECGLSLPTSNHMRPEDVDKVCAAIRSIAGHENWVRKFESGRVAEA